MNRSPDSVGVRDKAAAALSTVTRWMRRCLPRPGSSLRLAFDLAFGVVAPPVLLHLDLAWDPADLGGVMPLRPYAPLLAFGCIACLVAWLPSSRRAPWLGAFLAGPLLGGALFAFGIGVLFAPLAVLGTFYMGVGALGFVPLLTALVYLEAGLEALEAGRARLGRAPVLAAAGCAGLLVAALAAGAGRIAKGVESREIAVITGERPGDAEQAERRLSFLRQFPGVRLTRLERAASRAEGADGARLRGAFRRIAGRPARDFS